MSEPAPEPVVLEAPAAEEADDYQDPPAGQIEHPAVPTPADAIDHDQPDVPPALVTEPDPPEAQPGYPRSLLPPGAYFEQQ